MLFDNDTTPAFHPTRRHLLGAGSALALEIGRAHV